MTREDFKDIINSCYPVYDGKCADIVYYFYDSNLLRQRKLCRILNKKFIYPDHISGDCLFEKVVYDNEIRCSMNIWKKINNSKISLREYFRNTEFDGFTPKIFFSASLRSRNKHLKILKAWKE